VIEFIDGFVLGIETSGRLTGAALAREGRLVAEACLDSCASTQETLAGQVQGLLSAVALRPRELARIGVSIGPGSFTGLRVGLAAAQGLAVGADLPVAPVPSHHALAWPWRESGRTLTLLTGLRRGLIFLEIGTFEGLSWSPMEAAACFPVNEVPERIRAVRSGSERLLFLGEAVDSVLAIHPELLEFGDPIRDPLSWSRRPGPVAILAARKGIEVRSGRDLDSLAPLYLRGADAVRPGAVGRSR